MGEAPAYSRRPFCLRQIMSQSRVITVISTGDAGMVSTGSADHYRSSFVVMEDKVNKNKALQDRTPCKALWMLVLLETTI